MRPRELPGALALGIPTAILGHTLLFGESHQLGGSFHELFLDVALAGCAVFAALFAAVALSGASSASTGSVLAARLGRYLPGLWSLLASSGLWYAAIEAAEPEHQMPPVLLIAALLIAAALLVRFAADTVRRAIASIVLAVLTAAFAPRLPVFLSRRRAPAMAWYRRFATGRRFARPPPIAMQRA
jgi:hypothetical protein